MSGELPDRGEREVMKKPKPVTLTPKQALEMRLTMMEASTQRIRRGALGLFRICDVEASVDAVAEELNKARTVLGEISTKHPSNCLIAEITLSDSELEQLILIATRFCDPVVGSEISVVTPSP